MRKMSVLMIAAIAVLTVGCAMPGLEPVVVTSVDPVVITGIELEAPAGTVYTETVELSYTVSYSDGTTEPGSNVFTASAPGATDVVNVTVDGFVSNDVTINFEDYRLVGTWNNLAGNDEFTLLSDGTYIKGVNTGNSWYSEVHPDGDHRAFTRVGNSFDSIKYYFDAESLYIYQLGGFVKYVKQ